MTANACEDAPHQAAARLAHQNEGLESTHEQSIPSNNPQEMRKHIDAALARVQQAVSRTSHGRSHDGLVESSSAPSTADPAAPVVSTSPRFDEFTPLLQPVGSPSSSSVAQTSPKEDSVGDIWRTRVGQPHNGSDAARRPSANALSSHHGNINGDGSDSPAPAVANTSDNLTTAAAAVAASSDPAVANPDDDRSTTSRPAPTTLVSNSRSTNPKVGSNGYSNSSCEYQNSNKRRKSDRTSRPLTLLRSTGSFIAVSILPGIINLSVLMKTSADFSIPILTSTLVTLLVAIVVAAAPVLCHPDSSPKDQEETSSDSDKEELIKHYRLNSRAFLMCAALVLAVNVALCVSFCVNGMMRSGVVSTSAGDGGGAAGNTSVTTPQATTTLTTTATTTAISTATTTATMTATSTVTIPTPFFVYTTAPTAALDSKQAVEDAVRAALKDYGIFSTTTPTTSPVPSTLTTSTSSSPTTISPPSPPPAPSRPADPAIVAAPPPTSHTHEQTQAQEQAHQQQLTDNDKSIGTRNIDSTTNPSDDENAKLLTPERPWTRREKIQKRRIRVNNGFDAPYNIDIETDGARSIKSSGKVIAVAQNDQRSSTSDTVQRDEIPTTSTASTSTPPPTPVSEPPTSSPSPTPALTNRDEPNVYPVTHVNPNANADAHADTAPQHLNKVEHIDSIPAHLPPVHIDVNVNVNGIGTGTGTPGDMSATGATSVAVGRDDKYNSVFLQEDSNENGQSDQRQEQRRQQQVQCSSPVPPPSTPPAQPPAPCTSIAAAQTQPQPPSLKEQPCPCTHAKNQPEHQPEHQPEQQPEQQPEHQPENHPEQEPEESHTAYGPGSGAANEDYVVRKGREKLERENRENREKLKKLETREKREKLESCDSYDEHATPRHQQSNQVSSYDVNSTARPEQHHVNGKNIPGTKIPRHEQETQAAQAAEAVRLRREHERQKELEREVLQWRRWHRNWKQRQCRGFESGSPGFGDEEGGWV
ncbi:MAG: hypothetical protein M1831_007042 [Alyxoria varia]|nr:MAG: hypothetical protein M1831_007042 [Alyxoria varia]